jgi:hypothetical protein
MAGSGQKIKVEFTPDDMVNFSTVTDSVTIDVEKAILTVKADDQTITYGQALPELTYSVTGFVNGESLTSGIPSGLKIVVDTDGTLSAGTYAIRATGGVANNYTIRYIDGQLRVKKAELTVTALNQEMYIGNQIPTTSLAYSGFVNNETMADLDSLPIAYYDVEGASEAGIYPIKVAKGIDNNYDYKFIEGTLTIKKKPIPVVSWPTPNDIVYGTLLSSTQLNAKASVDGMFDYSPSLGTLLKSGLSQSLKVHFTPKSDTIAAVDTFVFLNVMKKELTVTADNKDKFYGNENPAFTFAYSGFINGEDESSLDSKPIISTLASARSDAGDYTIVLSGGADKNYQFNYKHGVLNIQKAKLTVQANTVSTPVGTIPQLSVSYSGFKNNDNETGIDVLPVVSTSATDKSPTGIYPIHVANGIDNNYDFIYVKGELIINEKLSPVLSWEAPSPITYGQMLDETQLNATANVPGKLIYTPNNGALLNAGLTQKLEVEFIPSDTINYNMAHKTVFIDVQKAHLTVKAEDKKIVQGETIPVLTYSIVGFVNGEDQGTLLSLPIPITTANIKSLPGKYPIKFSMGTDNNYEFTYVEGELTITEKQTPTLNWNTPTPITYGDLLTEKQLNATSTVLGKFIYTPAVGTLLKAGKAQKLEVAFFPDDSINYNSVSKSVTIDVEKALLTIKANDQTIVYGESIPELTYTTEGFVNGESFSTLIFESNAGNNSGMPEPLTSLPKAIVVQGLGVDAGTYTISVSGGSAANYNFAYSQGKLTVEKALLTVQVANGQMVVGTDVPKLSFILSGFLYSDNEKDIDKMPKVISSVSSSTPVGEYEMVAEGGFDNNYRFEYKSGLLKIVPKQIPMVSWKNPDAIVYGTQLSSVQLNATSNIEGKFVYTPSAGTLLGAGERQPLTVLFTPNSAAYEMVADTVFITIEKKDLRVTAQNQTIEEGNPLPNFTLNYDGFVEGDSESSLDQLPIASTTATSQSKAGEYPIIIESGDDDNYNLLYTNGLLTIQKKNGIAKLDSHFLNVFQNTNTRSITIENTSLQQATYLLTDLNGRKIVSGMVHCGKTTLQTPSIGNGLFLLQLQIGKVSRMFKVVY